MYVTVFLYLIFYTLTYDCVPVKWQQETHVTNSSAGEIVRKKRWIPVAIAIGTGIASGVATHFIIKRIEGPPKPTIQINNHYYSG
ncbi:hypothetical protein CBL_03885 [Carabus blaptoides fortunei]